MDRVTSLGLVGLLAVIVAGVARGEEPHTNAPTRPQAEAPRRAEGDGPPRGPKSFEPTGVPEGDENTPGTRVYLRKKFLEALPFAAGLDEDIRSTYEPARILYVPTPNLERTIHELFPNAPVGKDIDAMTVSAVVKRAATGKMEATHVVFLKTEIFDDPARLTVILNHELLHVAGKEKAIREGKLEVKSYAREEVEIYTKSIASIERLVRELHRRGDEASKKFAAGLEAQLEKERRDLDSYRRALARER
jgi:hypothetical protein